MFHFLLNRPLSPFIEGFDYNIVYFKLLKVRRHYLKRVAYSSDTTLQFGFRVTEIREKLTEKFLDLLLFKFKFLFTLNFGR